MNEEDKVNIYVDEADALSAVLANMRLQAEVYANGRYCGNWAINTSGKKKIPFHLLGSGKAWLHSGGDAGMGDAPTVLSAGDLVIFPHDSPHILSPGSEVPLPEDINQPFVDNGGPYTQIICGFFEFEDPASWNILQALPEVVIVDVVDQDQWPSIRALIQLLISELRHTRPGQIAVINQLAYLLFVQILRIEISRGKLQTGLLKALFDKKIGQILGLIHNHFARKWTLAALAEKIAMSRSSFAAAFHKLVGMPAMQYLTQTRMQHARYLLLKTDLNLYTIAEQCGYESEIAFRKAFKNYAGETPTQVRRNKQRK